MTSTSLNCTIPFSDPPSGMTLNCTILIPVQWITTHSLIPCSLTPPHHSSYTAFIEDTDNMQHMLTCPTLQMYPCDGSCCEPYKGPDGPVAGALTCYITNTLESDPTEHYSCSAPSLHHPLYPEHYTRQLLSYTSQITLNGHSLDTPLDALDGHSSLLEIHKTGPLKPCGDYHTSRS
jgi:hypothetical protein